MPPARTGILAGGVVPTLSSGQVEHTPCNTVLVRRQAEARHICYGSPPVDRTPDLSVD